jgi:predicted N-acetyltransferase YhbS
MCAAVRRAGFRRAPAARGGFAPCRRQGDFSLMSDVLPLTYRLARPDDVQAIRAIEYDAAQRFAAIGLTGIAAAQPMDAAFVRRKIAAAEIVVAVHAGTRCVGFAMFAPLAARYYIEELDVAMAWAGQRIGAALIARVAVLAGRAGARQLVLSTFREVPWNAPYYRRLGFRVMDEAHLDAPLRAIRAAHVARGFDETRRVFMCRDVEPASG